MSDKDTLEEEREAFQAAYDAESDNRAIALESLKFARLGEQWPTAIKRQREQEGRPVLTINKMPSFIRQVVNDSRMNRPQIKIKGVDDQSDAATANVIEGLVRNIEYVSKADVAYDTAVDFAASMGWGYLRLSIDYERDDSFDKSLTIKRVSNPFSVYGDPYSTEADSSDWNQAHVVEHLTKDEFKRRYKGAEPVDWEAEGYNMLQTPWRDEDQIMICEAWRREIVKRKIYLLSTGQVIGEQELAMVQDYLEATGVRIENERETEGYKITQRIMSGCEELSKSDWAGQYIPVIPVYGEEMNIEGKRHFRSLVHHAMDAQRMFNYWRSTSTELVALAPRVPFIGEEGAFDVDPNWATANTASHPYLMYKKGGNPPQRQPLDGGNAIGAMSEAMASGDDMKAIIGMYDASLGNRSNETSGVAINARKIEGDTSTYHFIDNLSRGIRHVGCCLVDLIPKVYSKQKILRVLGEDGKERVVKQGPADPNAPPHQDPNDRVYDLSVGRYDVAVSSGPGFTTKREQAAAQMTEFIRSFPEAAPVIGDILVKAMDWPQADEISDRIKNMMPPQAGGGLPPEVQQQIEEGKKQLADQGEQIKQDKLQIDALRAEMQLKDKAHQIELQQKDLQLQEAKINSSVDKFTHHMDVKSMQQEHHAATFKAENQSPAQ